MNRRNFIGKAAAGAAAVTIIPRHVMGGNGFVAANDRINLGYIGVGKQVTTLLKGIGKCEGTAVVAACDVFKNKLDLFVEKANKNNSGNGLNVKVDGYHFYRELLERSDIDAVVIASPDHWHAQMVVDAAKAGKDIYCEKPLSLTVAEGRAMVDATRKYDRVFQTGNMQRSWRDFRHAVELARNGYIGEIKEINVSVGEPVKQCDLPTQPVPEGLDWNEWIGPSLYRGYNEILAPPDVNGPWAWWRGYRDFGGGLITDWGAHMFDIAQWALNMDESGPVQFLPPEEPAQTHGLTMIYENGVRLNHKLWGGEDDGNGVQIIGTEGRIEVSRSFLRTYPNEKLAQTDLKETDKRVYVSDNHYQDWIDAMRNRTKPVSDVETGHRTASVCNLTNIAYELQRPLLWDPAAEKFKGDDYANLMVGRPYRGKWDYTDF
ncbi:gfo/Idh/MocA family oxidoreductase [Mariniphaga sediminis]|uniref:Gfo/Idh/MocA family oxidoreductase n=1 Tax=Mariniphaga sediminis TaxID=1628158 RepID=A0A399CYN8_9BACT|nr:Gfo/Idh/MocA family oxidoreductase [Mariniphaga sediminis]RIH64078.1 gfo/Idh/MocA family oxidoreductase [Mariniphaga sediminis]